jgi:Tfp pilus assembly protein PilF
MTEDSLLEDSRSREKALTYLREAVARLAAADAKAALAAASEACRREPRWPATHYAYGQAWSLLGEHSRAERAFAEAVRLKPDWPDAWVNYGIARYRQGFIEDAKTAMRHALRCAPGHAAAVANLGAFMRISGQSENAEILLRATLAREPDNAAARLNLAADLLQEERGAEALALLDAAKPPPGDPRAARHWSLQRSLALLQVGRGGDAAAEVAALEAMGPVPEEIAPLWRWRRVLIALARRDARASCREALAMETALSRMGPDAVLEHAIMARFDLAKFWSGQTEHARAFSQWVEGHKLLGKSQPFSRAAHRALVDADIAHFSAERFAAGPRAAGADPAPIFIVGMPRSGTTLAEQILAAHAQVHGAGERGALGQAFYALGGGQDDPEAVERLAALPQNTLDAAAGAYLRELRALAPDKSRIVDKMPGNFNYLGLVGLMLPGAKIIHCVRDPRDIGLSIFTFRFHGSHGYAHDLGDLGWYIGEHDRLMAYWKAALPNPILTVRLADWVEDFDATLARALAHLDLPPDPNCARFYENDSRVRTVSRAQVRQPVNAQGLGRWKTYARELAPLISELEAAGSLRDWG